MIKLDDAYILAKQEELDYLKAIHKHLESLKHLYTSGPLKNDKKKHYMSVGINNCISEKEQVEKEIKEYQTNETRKG